MEKVLKSYEQLALANKLMENYVSQKNDNKLTQAIYKFSKQLRVILEDYNDKIDTIQLMNCLTDPTSKAILKDESGNRQFTIEATLKLKQEYKKLLKEEVEITPIILDGVEEIVPQLSELEKEVFSGIVIK